MNPVLVKVAVQAAQSRTVRRAVLWCVALAVVAVVGVVFALVTFLASSQGSQDDDDSNSTGGGSAFGGYCGAPLLAPWGRRPGVFTSPFLTKVSDLDAEQREHAATIVAVGQRVGAPSRAIMIALMVALQESKLRNLDHGLGSSVGLFQQLDDWGPSAVRRDPVRAAEMFYTGGPKPGQPGLLDIAGWPTMAPTVAAQAVQRSGYPDAYAQWEGLSRQILAWLGDEAGVGQLTVAAARIDTALRSPCAAAEFAPAGGPVPGHVDTSRTACPGGPGRVEAAPGGTRIRVCTVQVGADPVNAALAPHAARMFTDAAKAGLKLAIGSGFRSHAQQISLRIAHCGGNTHRAIYEVQSSSCSPPTAIPGQSEHEWGYALDLTCGGALIRSHADPCFAWLNTNAKRYGGLKNYPAEPWHWSPSGR